MVDVEIWYYVNSESRLIRFSRMASFEAVPFIGSELKFPHDNLQVSRVTFKDGGGIVLMCTQDINETMWKDSELKDEIEDMMERGWKVASNVKRRR